MDTKSLICFAALVEEGNMRKVSSRLFISQQGMSRIIINLEKELGYTLFERKREGMVPTKEGIRLYESVRRMRTEVAELKRDLEKMQLKRPVLRIACAYGTLHTVYPLLTQFRALHPEIDISWQEYVDRDCESCLDEQEADIAFNVFYRENSKYIIQHLYSHKVYVLTREGDPLLEKEILSVADLKDRKIIMVSDGFHIFDVVKQKCVDHGFFPDIETGIREISLVPRLVSLGEGIGITVECLMDIMNMSGIHSRPLTEEEISWEAVLIRNADRKMTSEMELFWDFIRFVF